MSAPAPRKPGFGSGLRWLPAAAEMLFSNFGPLSGLAALWLLVSMIAVIPLIGQLTMMLITPLLTAGAIAAFAQTTSGKRPAPTVLFAAWHRPALRRQLLGIGLFGIFGSFLALLVVSSWLGSQVSPEQIQAAQSSPQAMGELLSQVRFSPLLLIAPVILAAVMSAMYFAIPLVMFRDIGIASALSTSLRAIVSNWAAFLGFGVVAIALLAALGFILGLVLFIVGLALGPAAPMVGQILILLTAMIVQVLMAGTQWVAFADVFGAPGGGSSEDAAQLLA